MPDPNNFSSHEEYLNYYRKYRAKNIKKLRKYNRKYNKEWRKKYGYHNEENSKKRYPIKQRARRILRDAVVSGKVKKKPCRVCKTRRVQAHHPDYSKPLNVVWFCHLHHAQEHKKIKKKLSTFIS